MKKTLFVLLAALLPLCCLAKGDYKAVEAGGNHVLVLKNDGTLWTWGNNKYGQLGDGTKTNRHSPVKIMDGVRQVSEGSGHSMAIKNDGSLWGWGTNYSGELGDGTKKNRSLPKKITIGVKDVSVGWNFSIFLTDDGELMFMGEF